LRKNSIAGYSGLLALLLGIVLPLVTLAKQAETLPQKSSSAVQPSDVPATTLAPPPKTAGRVDLPVEMTIVPKREIFTLREGLQIQMVFRALQPVDICFQKDPLTQFDIEVYRSGKGPLKKAPLVVQDTSVLFDQALKIVHLNPGQAIPYRVSLKRINFLGGDLWTPGDYTITSTFHLCDQVAAAKLQATPTVDATFVEGKDTLVKAVNRGHFMIMD